MYPISFLKFLCSILYPSKVLTLQPNLTYNQTFQHWYAAKRNYHKTEGQGIEQR